MGIKQKLTFKAPQKTSNNPLEYELFPLGLPKTDDIEQGKKSLELARQTIKNNVQRFFAFRAAIYSREFFLL